jgi:acetyltransferase-like isoleucine patch superfamily enzyme
LYCTCDPKKITLSNKEKAADVRLFFHLILAIMPMIIKRFVMNKFLGWKIHPTAHISLSFIMCDHLNMGPNTRIASNVVIQGLRNVALKEGSLIGAKSRISGKPLSSGHFLNYPDRYPDLSIGERTHLLHVTIDCQDVIEIGSNTTFAGRGTLIFTHSIDIMNAQMSAAPVRVGSNCMIGTGTIILKGVTITDRCVVGAGSVVVKSLSEPETLYAGSPAIARRRIPANAKYFSHKGGALK